MKHLLLFLALCPALLAATPNIVIILADDLGYGDMHANNVEHSKIPTPNMDQLAAEGMQFADWHSSSGYCSPSRCTLLKGADKPVRTHSINTACGGTERLNRRFSLQNQRVPRHS